MMYFVIECFSLLLTLYRLHLNAYNFINNLHYPFLSFYSLFLGQIYAEFQVPSPQIPNRHCYFVRSCNKIVDGLWVIVDVSLDHTPITRCWKRPSGCVIQQISNDISKVKDFNKHILCLTMIKEKADYTWILDSFYQHFSKEMHLS